ncbi:hypothetical protein [Vibrio viridaestus]|uniref:Nuclear transport factor 2 family protein n=1 Tax=Vibrio viridaestus TaxID=2487322 RepID=A0A3N9TIY3_9VIBR|nr:hypothetical protein [Vibrio viridaestus]RQW64288.1 hypothetical protein EES38_06810 [Vibrio viridaestus]
MSISSLSEDDIVAIADPIMDRLMVASTAIDYEQHIADFTPRLKRVLSADRFESICKEYQQEKGVFAERELVAIFKRTDSVAIVWRQKFTLAQGDYVAEMVLVEGDDGRYLCDHVMVF